MRFKGLPEMSAVFREAATTLRTCPFAFVTRRIKKLFEFY